MENLTKINLADFNSRDEFIQYLSSKGYQINEHCCSKIIIENIDSNFIIKLGINTNLFDSIKMEIFIYNEAKRRNLDQYFCALEKIGEFPIYTHHGIYQQKKLIIDKNLDWDKVFDDWANNGDILNLKNFLQEFKIFDLTPSNIGYDLNTKHYYLIDYSPNVLNENDSTYLLNNYIDNLKKI